MFDDLLNNLFSDAKNKIEQQKKQISEKIVEYESSDKKISVKVSAIGKIIDLKISEDLLKESHEMIEDLLVVNLNKAFEKAEDIRNAEMEKVKGQVVPNFDDILNSFMSDEEE